MLFSLYRSKIVVACFLTFCLGGCAAPLIITPGIALLGAMTGGQIAGVVMDDDTYVEIDKATVDPQLPKVLASSKRWLLTSTDPSVGHAARKIEDEGGFEVFMSPSSGDMTGSQTRELARRLCRSSADSPDVILSTSSSTDDGEMMGAGTLAKALFLGKINMETDATVHVLRCRDSWNSRFSITIHVKEGVYTTIGSEIEQKIGLAFGKSILELVGESTSLASTPRTYDRELVRSIQGALAAEGYYTSVVDGLYGPNTKRAISNYQASNDIAANGVPSEELLAKIEGR